MVDQFNEDDKGPFSIPTKGIIEEKIDELTNEVADLSEKIDRIQKTCENMGPSTATLLIYLVILIYIALKVN